jgi:hypothetical protein
MPTQIREWRPRWVRWRRDELADRCEVCGRRWPCPGARGDARLGLIPPR